MPSVALSNKSDRRPLFPAARAPAALAAMRHGFFARAVTTVPAYSRRSRQQYRDHPDSRCARHDNSIVKVDGSAHAARVSQTEKLKPDATPE